MRRALAPLAVFLLFLSALCHAELPEADEYEIKAAMLTNVFKLVDWPASHTADATVPLVIGIVSSRDMESALRSAIAKIPGGKTSSGRVIVLRKISDVAGAPQCNAIFIGGSDRKRTLSILQAVGSQPILTLGESDAFTAAGGMIGLLVRNDHVEVAINLPAAQSAGLTISSRLLRLAAGHTNGTP